MQAHTQSTFNVATVQGNHSLDHIENKVEGQTEIYNPDKTETTGCSGIQ